MEVGLGIRRASSSAGELRLIQHRAKGIGSIIGCAPVVLREGTAWNQHCWVFAQPAND